MSVGSDRRLTTQTRVTVVGGGAAGVAVLSSSEGVLAFFSVEVVVEKAVVA